MSQPRSQLPRALCPTVSTLDSLQPSSFSTLWAGVKVWSTRLSKLLRLDTCNDGLLRFVFHVCVDIKTLLLLFQEHVWIIFSGKARSPVHKSMFGLIKV